MIKKIVSIRNVGKFRNSASPGDTQLNKSTFIFGANGSGKTTICSILRSAKNGEAAYVLGRTALGAGADPAIELRLDDGNIRFEAGQWTANIPALAIFDGTFVSENVYSGDVVDIEHRRNLYRIVVGEEGVKLANTDADLAVESRRLTGEITTVSRDLQRHVPSGMGIDEFLGLSADSDTEQKIQEQERLLGALRKNAEVQSRLGLAQISLPEAPDLSPVLSATVEDISKEAEQEIMQHLSKHSMAGAGESWLAEGLRYLQAEECPFCGQDVAAAPLVTAYAEYFGDAYRDFKKSIQDRRSDIERSLSDRVAGDLKLTWERNVSAIEVWKQYCDIPEVLNRELDTNGIVSLREACIHAFDRKLAAPLEPVGVDQELSSAMTAYKQLSEDVSKSNEIASRVNKLIEEKKREVGSVNVLEVEKKLSTLEASKARHDAAVSATCDRYSQLSKEKETVDSRRKEVRSQLDEHTKNVIAPYQDAINDYLDKFNAGFRITETKHSYPGGIASSSYQIVINQEKVDIGDPKTPISEPSFKNTLSAGDRTTLALAFFLADLDRDERLEDRIVAFDDPFNSQDAFRRNQTVYEIRRISSRAKQVITLSHDAVFLKRLWEKVSPAERAALQIADARMMGSKIEPFDLDRACQGRVATEIDDLQAFFATGAGKPIDLIKKMRIVLETHCRSTYPQHFGESDWLGTILQKVGEDRENHPAAPLYDELDQINEYTSRYHHGENTMVEGDEQIDPSELRGFVRRTLRIANALPA